MVKRYTHTTTPTVWLEHIATLRKAEDIVFLNKTLALCAGLDSALVRKGLCIADVLLDLGLDNETLAAAIIYPLLQSQKISLDQVGDVLGVDTSKLLQDALQMQLLGKVQELRLRSDHQIENLRKMLLAMASDVRAVLIILAERLWQLHEAKVIDTSLQRKLAKETLEVYAPLANRLGIWQLKWEIEDLCLRYLDPESYNVIAKYLSSRRQEREKYIERVIKVVKEILTKAKVQHFQVSGRVKHIYSIYKKMLRKSSTIDEIYDISALRVLVESIGDCYTVLSLLQDTWPQVLKEFDDYISQPKPNGYRSIHTVLLGPENHYIEVQIRTYQMHQESELGVAAHWQYKEGIVQPANYEAKIALLRQVMAWQQEMTNRHEDQEAPEKKVDLFADRVYVFTPLGDIVDLPQGATPLDFAYQIHSEVGHRCRGAKVNGNIVPLTYQVQTGDRVEILTAKEANPSRDWMVPQQGYLKTARARARVQHWFRIRDTLQNILLGREMLDRELKKAGINERPDLAHLAAKFEFKNSDELLAALGAGALRIASIMNIVKPQALAQPVLPALSKPVTAAKSDLQILGVNNLLMQIARCCKPLPGDAVVGYITRNRGVSVHRRDCKNILQMMHGHQPRLVSVNWGEHASGSYPVDLLLEVQDRNGMLRDITTLLAAEKINVLGLQTQKGKENNEAEIYITIEIVTREQLQSALQLLQKVPGVILAKRR